MNSDGSGIQKFTNKEEYPAKNPKWSPDGDKILYELDCSNESSNSEKLIVKYINGSNRYEIKDCDSWTSNYVWSPNSDRIAFSAFDDHKKSMAFVVNVDGSNLIQLTAEQASTIVSDWK
jgi:Tol biopolymer transport system component